ncbi:MAG: hypothetical protein SGILL_006391, partial [Bacillariaceae sp.]
MNAFAEVQTSQPFRAITEAISDWCKDLVKDKNNNVLRSTVGLSLKDAIGDKMLPILLRIIPELRSLVNDDSQRRCLEDSCSVSTISLSVDEKRADKVNMAMLKQLFQCFMKGVSSVNLPIVFFVDDLQWADDASLELIQSLLMDKSQSLMFVGAFRSSEVQEEHTLSQKILDLHHADYVETHHISLHELSRMDVAEFIKDTLSLQHTEAWELSEPIYKITRGNINHAMQAIDALCLHEVDMSYSNEELAALLDSAILEGILMHNEASDAYVFVHDAVQEAARTIIYGEEEVRLNMCLGRALSKLAYDETRGEDWMVFAAAYLWSCVREQCLWPQSRSERRAVCRVNLYAANLSLQAAGFEEAASFLRTGIECLDSSSCWIKDYELTIRLYHLLMDAEFTLGNFEAVRQHIGVVQQNARSLVDKGPAFVHSLGIIMQGKDRQHDLALKKGKAILSWLGLDLEVDPEDVQPSEIQAAENECKLALEGRTVIDLLNEDLMEDDAIMAVLERMAKAAIYSGKVFFVYYLGQVAIRICAERGVSEYLPRIYMYSQMYFRKLELNLMAYECAVTCKKLIDEIRNATVESYCTVAVTCNNGLQLFRPTRFAVPVYEECYEKCIEAGNTEFAFLVANSYGMAFYLSGFKINEQAIETFKKVEENCRACQQPPSVHAIFQIYRQLALNLYGRSKDPVKFDGIAMNESQLLLNFEEGSAPYKQTVRDLSSCKTMVACILKDFSVLKSTIATLQEWPDYDILLHRFNMRLVWQALGAFLLARETRDSSYKKIASKYLKLYKASADQGNPNAKVISLCLEAENKQSKINYNLAIEACRQREFLHLEALMNENCGLYQLKRKKADKGKEYLKNAMKKYQEYGARAKVRQLIAEFDFLTAE